MAEAKARIDANPMLRLGRRVFGIPVMGIPEILEILTVLEQAR